MRLQPASCGGKRQTGFHARSRPAANYVTLPSLDKVQESIRTRQQVTGLCHILAELNTLFPLEGILQKENNPATVLSMGMRQWLESFLPSDVVQQISLSVQIASDEDFDEELFGELPPDYMAVTFQLDRFLDCYCPFGNLIEEYEKKSPGLGRYLLHIFTACPFIIGTPGNLYELASYYCWENEDDERSFIEDRCAEEVAAGEREEIAREYAESQVTIRYEEFEKNLPLWSFSRKENPAAYRKRLPEELRHLDRLYRAYRRHKYTANLWPRLNLPCVILGLDQSTFDFLCHVYNRIGNEQVQYYDGCYCLAGFGCAFQPTNSSQIRNALQEIRFALEYFGACIQFLLQHREEYPND